MDASCLPSIHIVPNPSRDNYIANIPRLPLKHKEQIREREPIRTPTQCIKQRCSYITARPPGGRTLEVPYPDDKTRRKPRKIQLQPASNGLEIANKPT